MSRKAEQLASMLKSALSARISRGLSDPRLEGCMVTVMSLQLATDFKDCTVLVSVYPAKHQSRAIGALKHAAAHIRREIGDETGLTAVPSLHFVLDLATKKQAAVIEALNKAREAGAYPDSSSNEGGPGRPEGGEPRS